MTTTATTTCPDWCTTTPDEHRDDIRVPGDSLLHLSAPFHGTFNFCLSEADDAGITAFITREANIDDMGPADLRRLAHVALLAAEWIEARS